jgi:hypothetical protein
VDSAGNAHVTGVTKETDFPTVNPLQPAYGGGFYSAFVFKLNPSGSALVYSTYWGGSADSFAYAIAVDSADNAYVTGHAEYESFPTTPGAFQTAYGGRGSENAFVSKFNPSGSALVYSTLLGGSDFDVAYGIAVDASGNAYVTGNAGSPDFPTTAGAFQTTRGTFGNAFITKINTTGAALVYSTYLGGNGGDVGFGIAVDSAGNAYVTGTTTSTDFPTVNPLQPTYGGGGDAFVSKFNPSGSALVYSTYLGGSAGDTPRGIAVDGFGNAYLTGDTGSTNFPTTAGTFQTTYGGQGDAFVAKIANGGSAQGGSVQGGGTINVSGGLANFGFNVQQQTNDGSVDGNLQYENHASGAKVHSVTFTGFTIDGNTAAFSGTCTNNGAPCTFNLTVRGNDQPQGSDSFIISINGGPPEGGTLKGGNINIRQ